MSTIQISDLIQVSMPAPPRYGKHDCEICRGSGYVQLRVHGRVSADFSFPMNMPPRITESSRDYPCPECAGNLPVHRLEVMRQESVVDIHYMKDPGFIQHVKRDLTHHLAEHMLKDGYIVFDDKMSDPGYARIRAAIGVVPKEKVLPVAKQMEQLEAKLTCTCGSDANHSGWEGHSPVSIYDHALDRAEVESERLKGRVEQLERRLEEVFP